MKVLYVVHAFNYGGIEQYILNTVDGINRDKYEIEVLSTAHPQLVPQAPELKQRNIPLYTFHSPKRSSQIREWNTLLKQGQYDIVHIQGMPNTGVLYLLTGRIISPRTKWIIHAHMGHRSFNAKKGIKALALKLGYHATNLLYRMLANVRAGCSHEAMQIHFGNHIEKKGLVLNNGIALARFRTGRRNKVDSRNLVCVARITDVKNPYFLIDVVEILASRNTEWHLTWVGTGIWEDAVRQCIKERKLEHHITLLGARKDIPSILHQHSIFLLASLYEAIPLTLIEAQAAGCICVSSTAPPKAVDCGALIRLPLELGAAEWARRIENLYENSTEMFIDEEKLSHFDIHQTAVQVEKLYDSLCTTNRK